MGSRARRARDASVSLVLIVSGPLVLEGCDGGPTSEGGFVDDLPLIMVTEDFRIGSVDDPDVGFAEIADVAVGPEGLAYVLEAHDQHIRVYDDAGRYVRTTGRRGEGPGEFTGAYLLGFGGDTLWVNDRAQQRFTLLGADGEVFSTFPVGQTPIEPLPGVLGLVRAEEMRTDGMLASRARWAIAVGASVGASPDTSIAVPSLVFDRSGEVVDTAWFEPVPRNAGSTRVIHLGGRDVIAPTAPSEVMLHPHFPDGRAVIERWAATDPSDASFTVTRIRLNGDTIYRRTFHYRPRGFEPAFVENLIWRQGAPLVETTDLDSAAVTSALRDVLDLPPFQTPVSLAVPGEDGSLWLRREDDGGPVFRWLILDPDGQPLGQTDLPRGATIHWARDETIYAAVPDELDIPWLIRYRIGG